jgi:hypothetical protein
MQKIMACAGPVFMVFSIVSIFLPKQPSAEERAIKEALNKITKKMDVLHGETMAELSQIGRNQFFLHATDKIEMLNQLVTVQSTFRNKYNKRALSFVCGSDMSECADAFRGWTGALTKSMEQLVGDSALNNHNEVFGPLSHNYDKCGKEMETTEKLLVEYPPALSMAISGHYTTTEKEKHPNSIPPPDLVSEFFIGEINKKSIELLDLI